MSVGTDVIAAPVACAVGALLVLEALIINKLQ